MACVMMEAQTAPRPVYDENVDPMGQIDKAQERALSEGKHVVCQLGGNWCTWCLRFADFITADSEVSKVISDNFVYIHVNYNPRRSDSAEKAEQTRQLLHRLGNPSRFGFPVLVVLDAKGKVLHIQDSSFLEEGSGYNREKVLRFFRNWTPEAVQK